MVNATVALIVISWYCQKDGFVNSTVCIAGLIEFSFISFEGGHPPKFTLIKGGGGMGKNYRLREGGMQLRNGS